VKWLINKQYLKVSFRRLWLRQKTKSPTGPSAGFRESQSGLFHPMSHTWPIIGSEQTCPFTASQLHRHQSSLAGVIWLKLTSIIRQQHAKEKPCNAGENENESEMQKLSTTK
jgi:hypothetical protein